MVVRVVLVLIAAGWSYAAEAPVDFNRDVRPILSDNCFACHGPDDKHRFANLRLDTEDGLLAKRAGYAIVTPGDPANSRLFARISAADKAARMPPPQAGTTLTPAQIADRAQMDRAGREVGAALVVCAARASGAAGGAQ